MAIAAARWRPAADAAAATHRCEPLSILKPVHGRDPRFYEAILSHATQDYPEFEILFGVNSRTIRRSHDIERLQREFPALRIEIAIVPHDSAQCQGRGAGGAGAAGAVPAPAGERQRHRGGARVSARGDGAAGGPGRRHGDLPVSRGGRIWASRFEALGIATEFAPSVLVARLLGVAEFALGSTMVFRAGALEQIGGFAAIANYLADDYQLGRHIAQLGYRIEFAPVVVETDLGGGSWAQTWRHQLRWSRTIRVSRPSGYYGYVVTHATLWGLVALAAHQWQAGAAALAVRILAGVWVGAGILGDRKVLRDFWLIPLRDLFGFAVWVAGIFGDTVQWRDRELKLRPDGRISRRGVTPIEGHPIDDGAANR